MNRQRSMAQAERGLVTGAWQGVTGVFTKPIDGAREEGFGGFIKGVGRGAVGLVTKPVGGVVNLASTSLNVIQGATDTVDDISESNSSAAEGRRLLALLDDGRLYASDIYEHHVYLTNGNLLLLTNRRFIIATMCHIFGSWEVLGFVRWNELLSEPVLTPNGILTVQKINNTKKLIAVDRPKDIRVLAKKMSVLYTEAVTMT